MKRIVMISILTLLLFGCSDKSNEFPERFDRLLFNCNEVGFSEILIFSEDDYQAMSLTNVQNGESFNFTYKQTSDNSPVYEANNLYDGTIEFYFMIKNNQFSFYDNSIKVGVIEQIDQPEASCKVK